MSDPGLPPTPPQTTYYAGQPPLPPLPPTKKSQAPLLVGLLVLLLALGGGAFAAVQVLGDDDKDDSSAIDFPDAWDERVLPYVEIAEKERDLEFKHPVEVRFLDSEAFVAEQRAEDEELTDEDRKEIEQTTGLFRAVGLISGDVDLLKAFKDFQDSGTLAYYSTKDKNITVRGTEITPAVKSTLVHELVHVLQDQHFDIGARTEELAKDDEDGDSADNESVVLDAVIEGDATRIETQYKASLSAKEKKELEESEADQTEADPYKDIPKVVVTLQLAPYVLGEQVVAAVAEEGGNDAVDDLFTDTPQHEAALLDTFEVLDGDTDAEDVPQPELADGEEKFAAGEFGSLTLFFMLAERIPMKQALAAADGWNGDRYVGYDSDGKSCVKLTYEGDTGADAQAMFTALEDWRKASPGAPITVELDGEQVRFQSCDPGKSGPEGQDVSTEALNLVAARTSLGLTVLKQGADARQAGCLAEGLVQAFTLEQLFTEETPDDPEVRAKIQEVGLGCR